MAVPTSRVLPVAVRAPNRSRWRSTPASGHPRFGIRDRLHRVLPFSKITLTEYLDVRSEFTGIYETILNPANRLHAEFWQRTGQLHPDITLDRNEETLPTDHGGRVGTSSKWW